MVNHASSPHHDNNTVIDQSFFNKESTVVTENESTVVTENELVKGLDEFVLNGPQSSGVKGLVEKFNKLFEEGNSVVPHEELASLTQAQFDVQKKEIHCSTVEDGLIQSDKESNQLRNEVTVTKNDDVSDCEKNHASGSENNEELPNVKEDDLIQNVERNHQLDNEVTLTKSNVRKKEIQCSTVEDGLIQNAKENHGSDTENTNINGESASEVVGFLQIFLSKNKDLLQSDLNSAADSLLELFTGTISLSSLGSSIDSLLKLDDIFDIIQNMINVFLNCADERFLASLAFLIKASSVAFTFFDKKLSSGNAKERYPVWHGREGAKWEEFYVYIIDGYPNLKKFYLSLFDPNFLNLGTSLLQVLMDKISVDDISKCEIFYDDVIHATKYELIKRVRETLTDEVYEIRCNEYLYACNTTGRRDDEKFNKLKLIDMTIVSSEENHTISLLRKR